MINLYFEAIHEFNSNNCIHNIAIYTKKSDIKYKHLFVWHCNTDEYNDFDNECDNDEFTDLYVYDNITGTEDLWMIFTFYENSINCMKIYKTYDEANIIFNEIINLFIIPYFRISNIFHNIFITC